MTGATFNETIVRSVRSNIDLRSGGAVSLKKYEKGSGHNPSSACECGCEDIDKELQSLCQIKHENLVQVIGSIVEPQTISVLTSYGTRGSLADILADGAVPIDAAVAGSLIADMLLGLQHLHDVCGRSHGRLSSPHCVVDERWVLRLTDFGFDELRSVGKDAQHQADVANWEDLWRAPELLRAKVWEVPLSGTREGDVYAAGIVMYEILGRQGPWGKGDSLRLEDILYCVRKPIDPVYRPRTAGLQIPQHLHDAMQQCWAEQPHDRPTVEALLATTAAPIIANALPAIARIESYAESLERMHSAPKRRRHQIDTILQHSHRIGQATVYNATGYDPFVTFVEHLAAENPATSIYVYFSGKSQMNRAAPFVRAALELLQRPVHLVHVDVGDQREWANPRHPLRTDRRTHLERLPTLMSWHDTTRRLTGDYCLSASELMVMFFEPELLGPVLQIEPMTTAGWMEGLVSRYTVSGYDAFRSLIDRLAIEVGDEPIVVYFIGKKGADGESWCPDCRTTEPAVMAACHRIRRPLNVVEVEVGDRPYWKNRRNPFRTDRQTNLFQIPTLLRWRIPRRMAGAYYLGNPDLLDMFFNYLQEV